MSPFDPSLTPISEARSTPRTPRPGWLSPFSAPTSRAGDDVEAALSSSDSEPDFASAYSSSDHSQPTTPSLSTFSTPSLSTLKRDFQLPKTLAMGIPGLPVKTRAGRRILGLVAVVVLAVFVWGHDLVVLRHPVSASAGGVSGDASWPIDSMYNDDASSPSDSMHNDDASSPSDSKDNDGAGLVDGTDVDAARAAALASVGFGSAPSRPLPPSAYSPFYGGPSRREIDIASDPLPLSASLRERLDAWRRAPGGRGEVDGEVEPGGFVAWNLEQCARVTEQHNNHMIEMSANVWAAMNRSTIHAHRESLITHMEGLIGSDKLKRTGKGRGIVLTAGNKDTLTRAKWSLTMMRQYGTKLPVQIFHFPAERPAADDPIRKELRDLGAELVEASGQEKDKGDVKSYHLKAIAMIENPWREVLYLDSDSVPSRDPEYMFDAPGYRRLGIWGTPDYWKTSANSPIWALAGVKCRDEWEFEAGQIFIDKAQHLDVLYLSRRMLQDHAWWFYFSDGDKDIFRWAMLMLRKRWALPGRYVGGGALPGATASGDFCSHTMLQHDAWGDPLFVHYNLLKSIPSGVGLGFAWGRTKVMPLFNGTVTPATARLGEGDPRTGPPDGAPGIGDVDCDMLADADEYGRARAPAAVEVMRRAVRERGLKPKFHGGWISALCIDFGWVDPRPSARKEADEKRYEAEDVAKEASKATEGNSTSEDEAASSVVLPDWRESPMEMVQWADDPHLKDFETTIFSLGFKPGW